VPIVSAVTAPPFATIHSEHRSKACLAAASAASAASTASDLRVCLGAGAPPLALRFILGVSPAGPAAATQPATPSSAGRWNFGDISLQAAGDTRPNPDNYKIRLYY
jgi:hypothetical protein